MATHGETATAALLPADARRLALALEKHFALVWRSLRRFGVGEPDVDDAAQLTFMTLARRIASVTPGSERAFLMTGGSCPLVLRACRCRRGSR